MPPGRRYSEKGVSKTRFYRYTPLTEIVELQGTPLFDTEGTKGPIPTPLGTLFILLKHNYLPSPILFRFPNNRHSYPSIHVEPRVDGTQDESEANQSLRCSRYSSTRGSLCCPLVRRAIWSLFDLPVVGVEMIGRRAFVFIVREMCA